MICLKAERGGVYIPAKALLILPSKRKEEKLRNLVKEFL